MATITTSTDGTALSHAHLSCMERNTNDGSMWVIVQTGATQMSLFKSTDEGVSWGSQGSFSASGLYTISEMRMDQDGDHIHLVFATNDGTNDIIKYKRIQINSGAADLSGPFLTIAQGANAGTPGAFLHRQAIFPYKNPDGSFSVIIASAYQSSHSGVQFYGVSIKNDGVFTQYNNNGLIFPSRVYTHASSYNMTVTMDVEHNGDGIDSATPNVWASFQIDTTTYVVKLAWQGYKTGWKSPTNATTIATGRGSSRDIPGRWDGSRFLVVSPNPSNTSQLDVFERNQSNTSQVKRTSPAHTNGVITTYTISWNHVTQDFRLYAVGTGTVTAYYVDYIRATDTWGSWTLVSATAPVSSQWGVRRSTYGNDAYDYYAQTGTVSPWTISNTIQQINFAPYAPTWLYGTGTVPTMNGAAFDVTSSLHLTWQFNDPNEGDTQGSYAVSRQIGTGTVQWWRASDSTWQLSEVQNTSATQGLTLTTGQWLGGGGASDPAHSYLVKTWDASGLPSPAYSEPLYLVPSSRVDPTITAPTASQILNLGRVVATWTNTEQSAYRVTLTNVATAQVVYDSGFQYDPGNPTPSILSYEVPLDLPDGFSGSLTLQTRNGEGLASVVRTVAFSVDFVEPVAVITTATPVPNSGGINVSFTQAAPSGAQPVTSQVDLYHRPIVTLVPTNVNSTFEVDASDWGNSGFASAARSTAQAHSGVASLLCTPNGSSSLPFALSTAFMAITPGTAWEFRAWFRATTTANAVRIYLRWYDNTNTLISSTTRDLTAVATTWIWAYVAGASPSNAVSVRLGMGYVGTPLAGNLLYLDDLQLFPANYDTGTRIVANAVAGTTYLDWRTTSGVAYEYRGNAISDANAVALSGPWFP